MNINMRKAVDDLAEMDSQIEAMVEEIERLGTELDQIKVRRAQLESFIRLSAEYEENPRPPHRSRTPDTDRSEELAEQTANRKSAPIVESAIQKAKRKPPASIQLDRRPDKKQTQIAMALVDRYSPGAIFTSHDAAEAARDIITDTSGLQPQHYIVNFVSREAVARNGIAERIARGKWRMRQDARERAMTIL